MQNFAIPPVDPNGMALEARRYVDAIAKPLNSLGKLESLAVRVATIQQTLGPSCSIRTTCSSARIME